MNCLANRTVTRLLIALMSVVPLVGVSNAQSAGPLLRIDVPFDFESGSHRLAAGVYFVHVASDHRLTFDGSKDRLVTITVPDVNTRTATKNTVVFRRYGDRYFLREVWMAGRSTHVHLLPTETEKQVETALKIQNKPGVMVALLDSSK